MPARIRHLVFTVLTELVSAVSIAFHEAGHAAQRAEGRMARRREAARARRRCT
jgi:hypothetical protein